MWVGYWRGRGAKGLLAPLKLLGGGGGLAPSSSYAYDFERFPIQFSLSSNDVAVI